MKRTASPRSSKNFPWNEVTPLSKTLAMVLFVILPFIGFILGMLYQQAVAGIIY